MFRRVAIPRIERSKKAAAAATPKAATIVAAFGVLHECSRQRASFIRQSNPSAI
jgi:hypothetical protein